MPGTPLAIQGYGQTAEANVTKLSPEAIAQLLALNIKALNSDAITWQEFGQRKLAIWDLAAQGEPNIVGTACERLHMQVQEHLDRVLNDRNPLGAKARTFVASASNKR